MDALGAPFHVVRKASLAQFLVDRLDELLDVGVTTLLRGIQLLLDQIVSIMLKVFQREILQLALQLIQTQLVGEGSIEIAGLFAHLSFSLLILRVAYLSQQIHTVGYHDQDNAHVLGKRQEEITEVLALNHRILLV